MSDELPRHGLEIKTKSYPFEGVAFAIFGVILRLLQL